MPLAKVADLLTLPVHPFAAAFPYLSDDETMALAEDIEANGLVHPIVLHDGQLLDGRNRLRSLTKTKLVEVQTTVFTGTDPVGYILSVNLQRRHLSAGQRAFLALALLEHEEAAAKERMSQGGSEGVPNSASLGPAVEKAGERLGVGKSSVQAARTLALGVTDASREAAAKVRSGAWTLNQGVQHAAPAKLDARVLTVEGEAHILVRPEPGLLDTMEAALALVLDVAQALPLYLAVAPNADREAMTHLITRLGTLAGTLASTEPAALVEEEAVAKMRWEQARKKERVSKKAAARDHTAAALGDYLDTAPPPERELSYDEIKAKIKARIATEEATA